MRILFCFIVFIFLSSYNAAGQEKLRNKIQQWEEKRHRFLPLPLISYTPETSWFFGASLGHLYRLKNDTLSNISYTTFTGFYTLKKQYVFNLQFQFNFKANLNRLEGAAVIENYPFSYFGLGNQNTSDDQERYNSKQILLKGRYLRRFYDDLFIGPQLRYEHLYEIEYLKDGGLFEQGLVPGGDGFRAVGVGINLTYDSRDHPLYPFEGYYLQASNHNYINAFGSTRQFYNIKFDLRGYYNLFKAHVLAVQSVFDFNIGDQPPFLMMAKIGGPQLLRGILRGKYRERNLLLAQIEYRFPIWWRFSGAIFGGAAEVMNRVEELSWPDVRLAGGGGVRFTVNAEERLNIRFDVGFGPDGSWGWYLVLNEAF